MLETDLIYLIFRKIHTLEISSREIWIPELSAAGSRMYLLTRRYLFQTRHIHFVKTENKFGFHILDIISWAFDNFIQKNLKNFKARFSLKNIFYFTEFSLII
jgi:hypothetical protein